MIFRLAAVFLFLVLAGCGAPRAMDPTVLRAGSPAGLNPSDYRLAAGDKVRIITFNELTLTGEFNINPDGTLSFPLVGVVKAEGKTTTELSNELRTALADGYLKDPKVSMEVLTYRPFYILGEVNKPGQYPFASGLTVLNAVATAEGFSYRAERRVAYIRRSGAGEEVPVRITPDLRVAPGDTIRIGERYF